MRYRRANNLRNGLIGAWSPTVTARRTGATGGLLPDLSIRGNHGALNGMDPAADWQIVNGYQSLYVDTTQNISVPASDSYNLQKFSILAWVQPFTLGTWRHVIVLPAGATWASPYARYALRFNNGNKVESWVENAAVGGNYATGATSVTAGLHFIGATYDGSTLSVYLDGKVDGTASISTSITSSSQPLSLANTLVGGSEALNGWLAEALVVGGCMTSAEMAQLCSLGPGGWDATRHREGYRRSTAAPATRSSYRTMNMCR